MCEHSCTYNRDGICNKSDNVIGLAGCYSQVQAFNSKYYDVLEHYGRDEQIKKVEEELNELKDAVNGKGNVLEEVADVLNMIEQIKLMYAIDNRELSGVMAEKMRRTVDRIEKSKQEQK